MTRRGRAPPWPQECTLGSNLIVFTVYGGPPSTAEVLVIKETLFWRQLLTLCAVGCLGWPVMTRHLIQRL